MQVLIYRLGSLGDTCIALPAFHLIERAFPNARKVLLTNYPVHAKAAPVESLLKEGGFFEDTIYYPLQLNRLSVASALLWRIRREKFDVVINLCAHRGLKAARRDDLFFKLAGIQTRIGFPLQSLDQEVLPVPGTELFESETERLVNRLRRLGRVNLTYDSVWDLRFSEKERLELDALLQANKLNTFLVIAPASKMPAKDWGRERWNALIERIVKAYPEKKIVFVGASQDFQLCEDLLRASCPKAGVNLSGKTSPRVSALLMKMARLFVGVDSGPMHLAATVGTPCVAIFSARSHPGRWYPRGGDRHRVIYHQTDCWGCELEDCIQEKMKCLTSITVDEVFNAVRELMP
jgi:ADP-heptose:LPS heptosyltransferase